MVFVIYSKRVGMVRFCFGRVIHILFEDKKRTSFFVQSHFLNYLFDVDSPLKFVSTITAKQSVQRGVLFPANNKISRINEVHHW